MRLPKFDDKDYTKCGNCGKDSYMFISKKCLHKLCESCFNKKFQIKDKRYNCDCCAHQNEPLELSQEDYSREPPLQIICDEDLKKRNLAYKSVYKRKENFSTNEEYNEYLEYVEKCIRNNDIDKLEKRYSQNYKERDENYSKRQKELEELRKKLIENSPTHYKNSKFRIDFDGNEINMEDIDEPNNQINYEPIKIIKQTVFYAKDEDKEKTTGGYNIKKLYEFLSDFSKLGFIHKKS